MLVTAQIPSHSLRVKGECSIVRAMDDPKPTAEKLPPMHYQWCVEYPNGDRMPLVAATEGKMKPMQADNFAAAIAMRDGAQEAANQLHKTVKLFAYTGLPEATVTVAPKEPDMVVIPNFVVPGLPQKTLT